MKFNQKKIFADLTDTPVLVKKSTMFTRFSGRFSNRNPPPVDDMDMWGAGAGYGGGNHVDMWGGQGGAVGDFWDPGPVRQGRIAGFFPSVANFMN